MQDPIRIPQDGLSHVDCLAAKAYCSRMVGHTGPEIFWRLAFQLGSILAWALLTFVHEALDYLNHHISR